MRPVFLRVARPQTRGFWHLEGQKLKFFTVTESRSYRKLAGRPRNRPEIPGAFARFGPRLTIVNLAGFALEVPKRPGFGAERPEKWPEIPLGVPLKNLENV